MTVRPVLVVMLALLPHLANAEDLAWAPERAGPPAEEGRAVFRLVGGAPGGKDAVTRALPEVIVLPTPGWTRRRYRIAETPLFEKGAPEQALAVKAYEGVGVDEPSERVRVSASARGLHAIVFAPGWRTFVVEPLGRGEGGLHEVVEVGTQPRPADGRCRVVSERHEAKKRVLAAPRPDRFSWGESVRTLRLAVTATGEYTRFYGGPQGALEAIVATVNRLNGLFERELGVRMVLTRRELGLIFADPRTDPFPTGASLEVLILRNQEATVRLLGVEGFDLGHVFSTGGDGGGLAMIGGACDLVLKAAAASTSYSPTGSSWLIDLVAHEVGHQLGARHTFDGRDGYCGANRDWRSAVEPGSGSTVMSYAGSCGVDDVAWSADPYFHTQSQFEMASHLERSRCGHLEARGNAAPTVRLVAPRVIPRGTPFTLSAEATDPDGHPVVLTWEQLDRGPHGPLLRSWYPTAQATRSFPSSRVVLGGPEQLGDRLPSVARALTFSVTARDFGPTGTFAFDTARIQVAANAGPLRVEEPTAQTRWTPGALREVRWDVARTDRPPLKCQRVTLKLSLDGGATFPYVLAASTANDGREEVQLPEVTSARARVRVESDDGGFFAVSRGDFIIAAATEATR